MARDVLITVPGQPGPAPPPLTSLTRDRHPTATQAHASLRQVRSRGRLWGTLALLGPAFVASVAYVDPGNFATNFVAGTRHGYRLVWVIAIANVMAMLVQYLSSKTGLATRQSVPELCRARFGRRTNIMLWLQGEAVAMATDLAEFVGAVLGLRLLFGMPLLPACLVTAVVSFALLRLQQRGYRRFEQAIAALLTLVAAGTFYLFVISHQDYGAMVAGVLPGSAGMDALGLTVGIIGATVIPHVVHLHSALQENRINTDGDAERQTLLQYNKWDCVAGLALVPPAW
jgi:manganese transport protein